MTSAPIAGLVTKTQSKPKTEIPTRLSDSHAFATEYLANSLREAVRKATGRSLSLSDSRAQITAMVFNAFFTGDKNLELVIDDDNTWRASLQNFADWDALVAVLPKEGDNAPADADTNAAPGINDQEGDSKNQERLVFENDEQGAGTHQANSEEEVKGAADSEKELSEMERLEREISAGGA